MSEEDEESSFLGLIGLIVILSAIFNWGPWVYAWLIFIGLWILFHALPEEGSRASMLRGPVQTMLYAAGINLVLQVSVFLLLVAGLLGASKGLWIEVTLLEAHLFLTQILSDYKYHLAALFIFCAWLYILRLKSINTSASRLGKILSVTSWSLIFSTSFSLFLISSDSVNLTDEVEDYSVNLHQQNKDFALATLKELLKQGMFQSLYEPENDPKANLKLTEEIDSSLDAASLARMAALATCYCESESEMPQRNVCEAIADHGLAVSKVECLDTAATESFTRYKQRYKATSGAERTKIEFTGSLLEQKLLNSLSLAEISVKADNTDILKEVSGQKKAVFKPNHFPRKVLGVLHREQQELKHLLESAQETSRQLASLKIPDIFPPGTLAGDLGNEIAKQIIELLISEKVDSMVRRWARTNPDRAEYFSPNGLKRLADRIQSSHIRYRIQLDHRLGNAETLSAHNADQLLNDYRSEKEAEYREYERVQVAEARMVEEERKEREAKIRADEQRLTRLDPQRIADLAARLKVHAGSGAGALVYDQVRGQFEPLTGGSVDLLQAVSEAKGRHNRVASSRTSYQLSGDFNRLLNRIEPPGSRGFSYIEFRDYISSDLNLRYFRSASDIAESNVSIEPVIAEANRDLEKLDREFKQLTERPTEFSERLTSISSTTHSSIHAYYADAALLLAAGHSAHWAARNYYQRSLFHTASALSTARDAQNLRRWKMERARMEARVRAIRNRRSAARR